jgi:hypothetical protein
MVLIPLYVVSTLCLVEFGGLLLSVEWCGSYVLFWWVCLGGKHLVVGLCIVAAHNDAVMRV